MSFCYLTYKYLSNNFSFLWKSEPDIPNSFGEIIFEKLETLQTMYGLMNVFANQQIISQFSMAAI